MLTNEKGHDLIIVGVMLAILMIFVGMMVLLWHCGEVVPSTALEEEIVEEVSSVSAEAVSMVREGGRK